MLECLGSVRTVCAASALAALLSSCVSETKLQADRPALAGMQRLGIAVIKEEEFSVRVAREEPPVSANFGYYGGQAALGLIVHGAVAISRSIADSGHLEQVRPALKAYDPVERFAENLLGHLRSEGGFAAVVRIPAGDLSAVRSKRPDGLVQVSLKQWGLRRCGGAEGEERAQVGFYIEARILSAASGEKVWERRELHLDAECRPVKELSQEGLLVKSLSRSVDYLSGKMASEIRFP